MARRSEELLQRHNISKEVFCKTIYILLFLEGGGGKYRKMP